jgi:hypothetical protein
MNWSILGGGAMYLTAMYTAATLTDWYRVKQNKNHNMTGR